MGQHSLRLSVLRGSTPCSLGAVGGVLPGKTGASALRARGPVALAELSGPSLPIWPRFRITSSCQIVDTPLRILESLRLLLFVVFAGEKQKCAWGSLMVARTDCGAG